MSMDSGISMRDTVVVAMTGASGAHYALRLIQQLSAHQVGVHLLCSSAARVVLAQECDFTMPQAVDRQAAALARLLGVSAAYIHCYALDDWFSPVASGSAGIRRMVVIPCSMGTLGRIANGISDNLIERAADVMLKERRQLILVPRETPFSTLHLENMLRLSRMGAHIVPAMPGFYHRPTQIDDLVDFMVERVIDQLDLPELGDTESEKSEYEQRVKRWGAWNLATKEQA